MSRRCGNTSSSQRFATREGHKLTSDVKFTMLPSDSVAGCAVVRMPPTLSLKTTCRCVSRSDSRTCSSASFDGNMV